MTMQKQPFEDISSPFQNAGFSILMLVFRGYKRKYIYISMYNNPKVVDVFEKKKCFTVLFGDRVFQNTSKPSPGEFSFHLGG